MLSREAAASRLRATLAPPPRIVVDRLSEERMSSPVGSDGAGPRRVRPVAAAALRVGRLLVAAAGLLAMSCTQIGDLGPQPYACTESNPACPDGYACDLAAHACEYPCNSDGSCPDGLTCGSQLFCIVPCANNDDCASFFNDKLHVCSTSLQYCVSGR
jgi:hypothetical protein